MRRILIVVLLGSLLAVPSGARRTGPWPKEKAWEWYDSQPWIRGCNYMSADCANRVDQWQELGFEERWKTQEEELSLAESIGFNTLRLIFAEEGFGVWYADHDGFMERVERTLALCASHGMRAIIVLGNDCSRPRELWSFPTPGPQKYDWGYHGGRKQSQHGSFPNAVGYTVLDDPALAPLFYQMCREVITKYKDDDRILFWDLWNEPGNNNRGKLTAVNLPKLFEIAWEIDPKQPLAADLWHNWFKDNQAGDLSDIISYHSYSPLETNKKIVADLRERYGRPIINTEWMARILDCNIEDMYPWFEQQRIGCTMWGFVAGKYQTYEPWEGTWKQIESGKGKNYKITKWFHDLFRPSLRPYDPAEIEIIKHVNHQADMESGIAEGKSLRQKVGVSRKILSEDIWNCVRRTSFDFEGYTACIVEPSIDAPEGSPWALTVSDPELFPDRTGVLELVRNGWHYASIQAPEDVTARFMRFVSSDLGLGGKAFVIGTGEEGKKAADLAYANRESVAALYLDGPVLEKKEPSKLAGELSKAGIPVLLMFGTMDKVASPEACAQFEEEFSKGGGNITTVRRELFGHYPLGLEAARVGIITSFVQAALK